MSLFDKLKSKVREAVEETKTSIRETVQSFRAEKIKQGLASTREGIAQKLRTVIGTGRPIDDALFTEIEDALISADVGTKTTIRISDNLRKRVSEEHLTDASEMYRLLREEIEEILVASNDTIYHDAVNNDQSVQVVHGVHEVHRPHVIMIVGVNGVGKTTTIGKLAHNFKSDGKRVLIGAADTFRAAANEQLEVWADRADVEIVGREQGADPASVAYDTLQAGIARGVDVVIVDTAGRLHNKTNLMEELRKMVRVMNKLRENTPNEIYIVLDATIGQNGVLQAQEFMKAVDVTGIVLTKLDGTAKGGVVLAIADVLKLPVRYIGVGEGIDDLQPFDAHAFAEGLFPSEEVSETTAG